MARRDGPDNPHVGTELVFFFFRRHVNRFHARIRRITVRLTEAQFNELRKRADDAGIRLATFIHAIVTADERKEASRRHQTA